jgi:hypothetical protein
VAELVVEAVVQVVEGLVVVVQVSVGEVEELVVV